MMDTRDDGVRACTSRHYDDGSRSSSNDPLRNGRPTGSSQNNDRSRVKACGNWREEKSSSGKIYYYNAVTEKSQWEKPQEWLDYESKRQPRPPPVHRDSPSTRHNYKNQHSMPYDESSNSSSEVTANGKRRAHASSDTPSVKRQPATNGHADAKPDLSTMTSMLRALAAKAGMIDGDKDDASIDSIKHGSNGSTEMAILLPPPPPPPAVKIEYEMEAATSKTEEEKFVEKRKEYLQSDIYKPPSPVTPLNTSYQPFIATTPLIQLTKRWSDDPYEGEVERIDADCLMREKRLGMMGCDVKLSLSLLRISQLRAARSVAKIATLAKQRHAIESLAAPQPQGSAPIPSTPAEPTQP